MRFPAFDVVDLSHLLEERMPVFPGDKQFKKAKDGKLEKATGLIAHTLTLGEHVGTHIDAPLHFDATGSTVDQIPASRLVLPAVMIDVRERTLDNPEYRFTVADFFEWEEENGWIPPHCMVVLHTGWGFRWRTDPYLGADELGTLHFPGFGVDVAEFLAEERSVAAIGIDTASVDVGRSSRFPVHRSMLSRGVILVENLANAHQLPERDFLVALGALKVKGGSGAPARVLAMIPKEE